MLFRSQDLVLFLGALAVGLALDHALRELDADHEDETVADKQEVAALGDGYGVALRWTALTPFKLGRPASEAQALLGSAAQGDLALERSYASETDGVDFQTTAGVVTRVTYSCYSG